MDMETASAAAPHADVFLGIKHALVPCNTGGYNVFNIYCILLVVAISQRYFATAWLVPGVGISCHFSFMNKF